MMEDVGAKRGKRARRTRLKRKTRPSENVFFNPRPICGDKCYDGLTLTKWSLSYRIGEVNMKLYFYFSRILREGHFPFSLLPVQTIWGASVRIARLILLLSLIFAVSSPALSQQPSKQNSLESIPTAEFARMIREFSEEGGYFMSDNFTSNETSYLHIVDKLRELGVTG